MRLVVLRCGTDVAVPPSTQLIDVKAVPTRQELKALDSLAAEVLPEDPTPSLAEIAAQPDVAHLGIPQYAPQPISDPLRVVVVGSDAALSAVLTRLMRADTMWVEVGFVPTDDDSPRQLLGYYQSECRRAVRLCGLWPSAAAAAYSG